MGDRAGAVFAWLTPPKALPITPPCGRERASAGMRRSTAGECPEWQRGRTVNPLAYAFVGSSPTSPTIPGEAEVGLGKTHDLVNDV
jgi:hypothetical protein